MCRFLGSTGLNTRLEWRVTPPFFALVPNTLNPYSECVVVHSIFDNNLQLDSPEAGHNPVFSGDIRL
jgi:hypothetical protein